MKDKSHVIGKAKHLQEIARRGLKVPLLFYIDHSAVMEALRQIPNFETRRKECSLRIDTDELAKLQQQAGQTFLPEKVRQELKMLLEKHRNKNWIVRSSFGVDDGEHSPIADCFSSEIVLSASAYDLSFAVMRVVSSLFSANGWTQVLAAGKDPNRCELGVIVQEHIAGTVSGVCISRKPNDATSGHVEWMRESQSERAPLADPPPAELTIFWKTLQRGMEKLETYFQGPVVAEWTFDGVDFWWLQARRSSEGQSAVPNKLHDRFLDVMTPMGWSLIEERLGHSMKSMVELTGIHYRNLGNTSLFQNGYRAVEPKSLTKIVGRSLFYGGKIGLSSLLGFMRLKKTPLSKSQALAALSHRVFLDEASKRVLAVWNSELEGHLGAIRSFDASIHESPDLFENAVQKINELRALCFAYFKTDIAIQFLKEANEHFVSEGLARELDSTSEMQENALALFAADEQQRKFARLYIEKSSEMLSALAEMLMARGRLEREDDIHFVTAKELEDFLKTPSYTLQFLIRRRRELWSLYKSNSKFPDQLDSIAASERLESGRLFESLSPASQSFDLSHRGLENGYDEAASSGDDELRICN